MEKVTVIGAGLAGSEAAWQLAEMGVPVKLAEMRPAIGTPAHHTSISRDSFITMGAAAS